MLEVKIRPVGNSVGVILPRAALQWLHLEGGDRAVLRQSPEGIVIMKKKTLQTLGKGQKSKEFEYSGSTRDGVVLLFKDSEPKKISGELFQQALRDNAGKELPGGFNMKDVQPGGFGEWVYLASNRDLTPRHASFVAAILCNEAGVSYRHEGHAVFLKFPKGPQ